MLNMETSTKKSPAQVAQKAKEYFGPGGLGLELSEESDDCLTYSGSGGYVRISICESEGKTRVSLLTQEWETPVKKFAGSL